MLLSKSCHLRSIWRKALTFLFTGVLGGCAGGSFAAAPAAAFTTLVQFKSEGEGCMPIAALIQGNDGNFYGSTNDGGPNDHGILFKMLPSGSWTTLHAFGGADGDEPDAALIQASDGGFYGTADYGGPAATNVFDGDGIVFKMNPDGMVTTLHAFADTGGNGPVGGLVQSGDGFFYGMTSDPFDTTNSGSIYKMTSNGAVTTLHAWPKAAGAYPASGLIQASDGAFYGTTSGDGGLGTIFKVTPDGAFTTLHTFTGPDGAAPEAALILARDGNFYGTTRSGGASYAAGANPGLGTVFKMTPDGTLTVLHSFSAADGFGSVAALLQGGDGGLYGTTRFGGAYYVAGGNPGFGTVFKITTGGVFTVLHSFDFSDGREPLAAVVQASDGSLFGTTSGGGLWDYGVVYKISFASINLSPSIVSVSPGKTQLFSAVEVDLNGAPAVPQPTFTWTVSGGGTIDSSGLFTAGGAAGGPFAVTVMAGFASAVAAVTVAAAPVTDFNGDGNSDLVLQSTRTNQAALWYLNGASVLGGRYLSVIPPAGWRIAGASDFNGDGNPDLVLQNAATGQAAIWHLNNGVVVGGQYIAGTPPGLVVACGDFNADGNSDIVFQDPATNKVAIWIMNGGAHTGDLSLSLTPPSGWGVTGCGNFGGDGKTGLVLQNAASNRIAFWYLDGATVTAGAYASITPPTGWRVAATGDFNGDGKSDLVLQNAATGQIALWYMNGSTVTGGAYLSITPAADWKAAGPR